MVCDMNKFYVREGLPYKASAINLDYNDTINKGPLKCMAD